MLYFPQLSSGATGQFPIRKRSIDKTIVNRAPDGRTIKYSDAGATLLEWQLAFQSLDDGEINVLQQFFSSWKVARASLKVCSGGRGALYTPPPLPGATSMPLRS